jgi:hypothetical protein
MVGVLVGQPRYEALLAYVHERDEEGLSLREESVKHSR